MIYWVFHIFLLALLATLFYKKFHSDLSLLVFTGALLLKLAAGLTVGWIFYFYYGYGDTIMFFEESSRIARLPFHEYISSLLTPSTYSNSSEPRVHFFTKILSFFTLVSGGSYWISSLYLSFISFCSAWYFVITIKKILPSLTKPVIICLLFIPTIIFWSSGILKDTLAFSSLAFLVGVSIKKHHGQKLNFVEWLIALLCCFLLFKVKHYLLITFLLFIGTLIFMNFISKSELKYRVIAFVVLVLSITATQFIHPYLKFNRLALTIYENNQAINGKTDIEDKLNIVVESPEFTDILTEVPSAIQIGLFRPGIFDHTSIWGLLHRIENSILAFLFVISIIFFFKHKPTIDTPLMVGAFVTILILATMLSLSAPNFGTLVRYKNAFLPFFFLICSILPYRYFTSKWQV